jgi:TatD DNase family protein
MNLPGPDVFIDIHTHGGTPHEGYFLVDNLMSHENRVPDENGGMTYTIGVHPWFLTKENLDEQISVVSKYSEYPNIIAIGEAGFDKLRGPSLMLQGDAFEKQAIIADKLSKPLFIHCVRYWDELLFEHKKLNPSVPWLVHGFRGKKELGMQLIDRGMYLSFWFDFVLRPESTGLVQNLPKENIFLETDGSGVGIETIYKKVAADLQISVDELKTRIFLNFEKVFAPPQLKLVLP